MGLIRWYNIYVIVCGLVGSICARDRVRIVFINNAPEDVYVTINTTVVTPGNKHCVPSGTRKYIFAIEFSEEKPLYVTVLSMSYDLKYRLVIHGNLARTSMRACRSYGDIELVRYNRVVDTISAINLEKGFILKYSPEYELSLERIGYKERPQGAASATRMSTCRSGCSS